MALGGQTRMEFGDFRPAAVEDDTNRFHIAADTDNHMMEADDDDDDVRAPVGRTRNILESAVVFTPDFILQRC